MFTGLIEAVGEVLTFEQVPGGARLVVATSLGSSLQVGESLAVNGVCLTVVEHNDHAAAFRRRRQCHGRDRVLGQPAGFGQAGDATGVARAGRPRLAG